MAGLAELDTGRNPPRPLGRDGRETAGITQAGPTRRAAYSPMTVACIESGEARSTEPRLRRIAGVLSLNATARLWVAGQI